MRAHRTQNGDRLNNAGFLKRVLPEEALKMLAADLQANPIALPSGYFWEFGGDSQEQANWLKTLWPAWHDPRRHAGDHIADL